VTTSDFETRVAHVVLAVCAVVTGPTAFAQKNEQQLLTLRRAVTLSVAYSSDLALATAQRARELRGAREVAGLELQLARENLRILQQRCQADRRNLRVVEGARLHESDKWLAFLRSDDERQQAQLKLFKTTGQLGRLFP
jgi:hypothetical protein